ncbi:thioredoxin family protein [Hyphococcus luteus]|nr:thioredoxin family protein [Marinicaulis flavus]
MKTRLFLALAAAVFISGCAVAKTATGAAAGVGKTAVKTTAGVTGDVAGAAFASGDNDDGDPRPFEADRNAMMDVDAALQAAKVSRRNVLLVLGANWCHDSRGLAAQFERPELSEVIAQGYELVWVDTGYRDRNLDVAARFGVMELYGTPTVLIVSPEGALLNRDSVHDWRKAASTPYEETLSYFRQYAGGR